MKKYKVIAAYTTYCTLEIEARDYFEAHDIANEADGGDFTPSMHNDDWHIVNIVEIKES
jgi:hypothetical protein